MKRSAVALIATAVTLAVVSCNYSKPHMYVTLTNNSGAPLRNVEIQYPGGIYGMASLGSDQTNRRLVQFKPPCNFTVKFDLETSGGIPHQFDLGETCPKEVIFTVEKDFKVSRRIAEP